MNNDDFSIFTPVLKLNARERYCTGNMSLLRLMVKRWDYCPPEDATRIAELAVRFAELGAIPGVISIAVVEGEGLVCWDGNHRFRAALQMESPPQLLFHVWENPTVEELQERYQAVNSGVNHASLFSIRNCSPEALAKAEQAVEVMAIKYRPFFTPRANPREPHTNREAMTEVAATFFTRHPGVSVKAYSDLLEKANAVMAEQAKDLRDKVAAKCKQDNCYLFVKSVSLPATLEALVSK